MTMRQRMSSIGNWFRGKCDPRYHMEMTLEEFCDVIEAPQLITFLQGHGTSHVDDVVKYRKDLAKKIEQIVVRNKFEEGAKELKKAIEGGVTRAQSESALQKLQESGPLQAGPPRSPAVPRKQPPANPYGEQLPLDKQPSSPSFQLDRHYETPAGAVKADQPPPIPDRTSIHSSQSQSSISIASPLEYDDGRYDTLTEADAAAPQFEQHDYDYIVLDRKELQAPVPDIPPAPLPRDVLQWDNSDVVRWLALSNLSSLKSTFYHADINGRTLLGVQRQTLVKVGSCIQLLLNSRRFGVCTYGLWRKRCHLCLVADFNLLVVLCH
eukprot:m.267565 g.267565  ORF g.267565 m.267565 type:complete len:323 (-) comp15642_c0_seq4:1144-2112(-)